MNNPLTQSQNFAIYEKYEHGVAVCQSCGAIIAYEFIPIHYEMHKNGVIPPLRTKEEVDE